MCGRFGCVECDIRKISERFNVTQPDLEVRPRYNIAPTQNVYAILNVSPNNLTLARWGLIPHWAENPLMGNRMINARSETLTIKPSYKGLVKTKRCLIIADSFYEWKKERVRKRPFRITLKDDSLFAFAGLWDVWEEDGQKLLTCTIITTAANALIATIHDRMPAILRREDEEKWLKERQYSEALSVLKPFDANAMKAYEISPLVNSPDHDSPEVIRPFV